MIFLEHVTHVIGILGVVVIVWGVLLSILCFLKLEFRQITSHSPCLKKEVIRNQLGAYILLGLEFLLAADVIHTLMKPTLLDIAILSAIVALRIILSFFLNKEIANHEAHN